MSFTKCQAPFSLLTFLYFFKALKLVRQLGEFFVELNNEKCLLFQILDKTQFSMYKSPVCNAFTCYFNM